MPHSGAAGRALSRALSVIAVRGYEEGADGFTGWVLLPEDPPIGEVFCGAPGYSESA
jgi:hypothetical protein